MQGQDGLGRPVELRGGLRQSAEGTHDVDLGDQFDEFRAWKRCKGRARWLSAPVGLFWEFYCVVCREQGSVVDVLVT